MISKSPLTARRNFLGSALVLNSLRYPDFPGTEILGQNQRLRSGAHGRSECFPGRISPPDLFAICWTWIEICWHPNGARCRRAKEVQNLALKFWGKINGDLQRPCVLGVTKPCTFLAKSSFKFMGLAHSLTSSHKVPNARFFYFVTFDKSTY